MLLPNPSPFLDQLFQGLQQDGITVSHYELDHICYRVETMDRYRDLKKALTTQHTLLSESIIGGRPIATFQLHQPLIYHSRKIELLELPAPKANRFYAEGYEHVEFVIEGTLEEFKALYPQLTFDEKGLQKKINPDLRIQYDLYSVKFHLYNLAYVIKYLD